MDQQFSDGVVSRARLQEVITDLEPRLRRRIRGKLHWIGSGWYDWDDLLASTRRRVDEAAVEGRLVIRARHELDAYIQRVADHVVLDVIRRECRERRAHVRLASEALQHSNPTDSCDEQREALQAVLGSLDEEDRAALESAAGEPSQSTRLSRAAVRGRWRRLLARVRAKLTPPHPQ